MRQAALTKCAVILQVVAILFLQWYPFASQVGQLQVQSSRTGSCGCPAERVANHTCCCSRARIACCAKAVSGETGYVANRPSSGEPVPFSSLPCQNNVKFCKESVEKLKFVRPVAQSGITALSSTERPFYPYQAAYSRFLWPPDPPPPEPLHS